MVNDVMENMCKASVVACLRHYPRICPEKLRESARNFGQISHPADRKA